MSAQPPKLFNRALRRLRHQSKRMSQDHFLAEIVADRLIERFSELGYDPKEATWVAELTHPGIRNCLASRGLTNTIEVQETHGIEHLPPNAKNLPAIAVLLTLHVINDLPGVLLQLRNALAPGGLFLASFPGGQTLVELRDALTQAELAVRGGAAMRVHPMIDVRDAAALMQRAGFSEPITDVDRLNVNYSGICALMHELRTLGEAAGASVHNHPSLSRRILTQSNTLMGWSRTAGMKRCSVSYDLVTATGWTVQGH